jgi:serine/threonine-protein kinase
MRRCAAMVAFVLSGAAMVIPPTVRKAQAQASPQDTDRMATATSLFEAGQRLVAEGRAAEACPKFEESYRLVEANGTLINLADCYERIGKTASAWLTFREVAQQSRRDGQDARADVAEDRAGQLAGRLTKLRIGLGPNEGLTDVVVERDGIVLGPAALGVPVPVDPGEHEIRARAPGKQTWRQTVTAEGQGAIVEVTLPPLETATESTEATGDDAAGPPRPWQLPMGITLLSIGGAGVITGIALGGAAKAKADGADCDADDRCSTDGLATRDDAVTLGNIGTGIGIAGAVIGGLGLTLWLTAPSDRDRADEEPALGLWLGDGIGLSGRF